MARRATFLVPGHHNEMYFFSGEKYARIYFKAASPDENVIYGPLVITDAWAPLKSAGFTTVDAILPSPRGGGETYFFSGNKYIRTVVNPGTEDILSVGPAALSNWHSLKEAGFEYVDACLPNPNDYSEVYFFSGDQCVYAKYTPGSGSMTTLAGPAPIVDFWPSLKEANFYIVDTILPRPNIGEAYVFSGSRYVRITVTDHKKSTITYGPAKIVDNWKTLQQVGFYH